MSSTKQRDGHPTTSRVASAIRELQLALEERYRSDYSFTVMGFGYLLGAANRIDGQVDPCTENK